MKKFTLLGGKLGHSLSPQIHKILFEMRDKDSCYDLTEMTVDELKENFLKIKMLDGFNITIPHKTEIIPYLDKLDETALRYGAVNCVDNKNGVLTGYNTDCDGFLDSIKSMGVNLAGKVLLIGCGGAGRMIAIESALCGADLTIQVREKSIPLAEKTAKEIYDLCGKKVRIITANNEYSDHYDLLINATPVGMYPDSDLCPVTDEVIGISEAVFDVIYNPLETVLIKKAKSAGKKAEGGMQMLVRQAISAHKIWDNDEYTDEETAYVIKKASEMIGGK